MRAGKWRGRYIFGGLSLSDLEKAKKIEKKLAVRYQCL
jgi:hypothetical protein